MGLDFEKHVKVDHLFMHPIETNVTVADISKGGTCITCIRFGTQSILFRINRKNNHGTYTKITE